MAKNQRKYTDEFWIEAVRLLEKSDQSVSEVVAIPQLDNPHYVYHRKSTAM